MASGSLSHRGELLVSLGLIALGTYILAETRDLGAAQGYEQLGPRMFPYIIGSGLVIFGAILACQALYGGWRAMPAEQEAHLRSDWFAFGTISVALILHLALIGSIGFVFASTGLFALVARGFGSRQWLRNVIVGAVLSAAAYYVFTFALGLHLPASILKVI